MPRAAVTYLVIFLVTHIAGFASGKDFPIQHFTVENGLPSNNVYSIYRDHAGFLWLATDKGVVRYNGIVFEKFTTDNGLPDNDVFYFVEDIENRLWICCYNGGLCYYKDGIFHTAANTPFLRLPYKHQFPATIHVEADSSVTFMFNEHQYVLNIHGNTCKSFLFFEDKFIHDALRIPTQLITRASANRYNVFRPEATYIIDTNCKIIDSLPNKNNVKYFYPGGQNQLYRCTSSAIYSIKEDLQLRFTNNELITANVYKATKYGDNWFVATNKGLFINNDIQILGENKVTEVNRDIEGNYWISSLNNGVFCLPKDFLRTERYADVYSRNVLYACTRGDYLLYTTSNGNFYRFAQGKPTLVFDQFKYMRSLNRGTDEIKKEVAASPPGILVDKNYHYYCMNNSFCLSIDNFMSKTPHAKYFRSPGWVGGIKKVLDGDSTLFIRSSFSVCAVKKANLSDNLFPKMGLDPGENTRICDIATAPGNVVWFSTPEKVCKIEDGKIFPQRQFGKTSFKSLCVAGTYLVGISQKNELVVCNNFSACASIKFYSADHCIWDKIYRLSDSSFLVSTDNQYRLLKIFSSPDKPVSTLQVVENESLPPQPDYICSNDTSCYFFKNGSITRVPIDGIFLPHTVPSIFFKSLRTRNNIYPIKSEMKIEYGESKNIDISFAPFSFGSKYLVSEYSISKDSTDYWRPLINNEINLFDAPYGHYIVKIKARTLGGGFSAPYLFTFTILKPFWATWWFYAMAAAFLAEVIALVIKRYQKNAAKEKSYLQKELSALRQQMNPHFLFNTLNSIYSLATINSPQTPGMVHKLSELLRYTTYKSTQPITTLAEEVTTIETYITLQMVRFEGRVNMRKNIDIDEPEATIVPLLLLPLIENAFKHGVGMRSDNSFISIAITLKEKLLKVEIRNSIASESVKAEDYKGLGLSNTRRQLALLYSKYELLTSDVDNIFVLTLKIHLNSYAGN